MSDQEAPRPLTEDEAITSDTVVWVGSLPCGCRPFSVIDTAGRDTAATDTAFGLLLAQSATVKAYSVDDAARIVAPCTHNVAIGSR